MYRSAARIVAVFVFFLSTFAPRAQAPTPGATDTFDPPETRYTTGDDREIDPVIARSLAVADHYRAFLPVSVDLSTRMPPPGDQGRMNSCAAWATAYAARSYYAGAFEGRDPNEHANVPSPNYVYHLAREGNTCDGTNMHMISEVLKKGGLSLADYPYNDQCAPRPAPQYVAKARDFHVRRVIVVNHERIDDMKGQLARANPVVISFHDSPTWHRHRGAGTFADLSFDPDENKNGWHAMVLVGYDDRRQAFRLMNSWGRRWGDGGYAWVDYNVLKARIRKAGILDVAKPKRPVAFTPIPSKTEPVMVTPPTPAKLQPVQPAPVRPAVQRPEPVTPPAVAQFSDLQKLDCARITVQSQDNRNILSGFVASDYDLSVVQRVSAGVPNTSIANVIVAPWPQCETLYTLERPLADTDRPTISIGSSNMLRDGDPLRIEIKSPAQISYLYVAYIQADGSVVHLAQPKGIVPQSTLPNTTLIFGDGQDGRARFTISKPFGREMIIAIAARSPLFSETLPAAQTEREYLSMLRKALIYKPSADLPDREIAASMTTLQTRARSP